MFDFLKKKRPANPLAEKMAEFMELALLFTDTRSHEFYKDFYLDFEAQADKHAGIVDYSMDVDEDSGDYGTSRVLFEPGEVPGL